MMSMREMAQDLKAVMPPEKDDAAISMGIGVLEV